ncbi:hypothetical protein IGI04_036500 [Brassica rapa subsp. trilocularis]|uniref:Uncharacterized protein n=1 Tax=Brassica rapa subsp. trilocularis TaxID=1813537 RepID=A0ABQ7LHD1_BRACM|nr:hypothetical protein IGI04_036500 [Brassica rapa subsp. trilocularis]
MNTSFGFYENQQIDLVIHGFIPANGASHYRPNLKPDSIVKLDRSEASGSDLKNNAATTRVVVCLLIEPYVKFYFSAVRFIAASLAATAIFSMNACSFRRRGSLRQRLRPNATSASERR